MVKLSEVKIEGKRIPRVLAVRSNHRFPVSHRPAARVLKLPNPVRGDIGVVAYGALRATPSLHLQRSM